MTADTTAAPRSVRTQSVVWVLAATGISGVSGFVVTLAAAAVMGAADYAIFGVFWSGLFLVVGILFGLQQEATRATVAALVDRGATVDEQVPGVPAVGVAPGRSSLWIFGAGAGLLVGLLVYGTSTWWAPATLGEAHSDLALHIALGSALNAVVATMSGALAGAARWRLLAGVIGLDGILRLAGVAIVLASGADPAALAWAVILPFPLSIGIIFLVAPRTLRAIGRSGLTYRTLTTNSGHTVVAASATAVLINGFPLILAFFAGPGEAATLGALILAIVLTRAPILLPMMALQSYLVTRFTNEPGSAWKILGQAFALIATLMAVLTVATALWGTWALSTFVDPEFGLSTSALVPLVVSSGFIGALCVTGPALLASGRHRAYALGWIVASIVALAVLFVPVAIESRASLALSIGPIAGLVTHLAALWRDRRRGN